MKVLVTGGAGFIGSHLVLRLLNDGHEVVIVDNLNEYYDPVLKEKRLEQFKDRVDFCKVDIADQSALAAVFEKHTFDLVCHLAAQAGVRYSIENPYVYADANYVGTLNILELSKQHNVGKIVFASTSSVYGNNEKLPFTEDDRVDSPISVYAASKRGCELLASTYTHLHGLNVTCLRFFTVYGPMGRPDMALFKFTKAMLAGEKIDVYNNGDMKRDFTFVTDIVDGFVRAAEKCDGFNIYNLGCGNPVKLMDFIHTLEEELRIKADMNLMPIQPGDVPVTSADISKAQAELGYEPKVHVKEGVKAFVDWYKEYYSE